MCGTVRQCTCTQYTVLFLVQPETVILAVNAADSHAEFAIQLLSRPDHAPHAVRASPSHRHANLFDTDGFVAWLEVPEYRIWYRTAYTFSQVYTSRSQLLRDILSRHVEPCSNDVLTRNTACNLQGQSSRRWRVFHILTTQIDRVEFSAWCR